MNEMIFWVIYALVCTMLIYVYLKFKFIRVTKFLIIDKKKLSIHQSLSKEIKLKFKHLDRFNEKNLNEINREIINSIKDLKEYFDKTNIEEFTTNTNNTMVKQLKRLEKQGYINLERNGKTIIKKQVLEKLTFMGTYTLIVNLLNKEYWKYIFRDEEISKYRIIIDGRSNSINNNLNKKNVGKKLFTLVGIFAIALPFIIFVVVYYININKFPIFIDKKDILVYYGSIIGGCFTGFITAGGLYYTFKQSSASLFEQRKFDIDSMEKQESQFNKDYNITLINQKLERYKDIFLLIEQIINKAVDINHKVALNENVYVFNTLRNRRVFHENHIKDIEKLYELSNKYNFMSIFITEKTIIDLSKEAFELLKSVITKKNNVENSKMTFEDYVNYYDEVREKYVEVSNELKRVSEYIYIEEILIDMKA